MNPRIAARAPRWTRIIRPTTPPRKAMSGPTTQTMELTPGATDTRALQLVQRTFRIGPTNCFAQYEKVSAPQAGHG